MRTGDLVTPPNDPDRLRARIAELERELAARDKTIEILVARVDGTLQNRSAAFTLFEQNVLLEDLDAARGRTCSGQAPEQARTLQRANELLERACRAKDEFLAVVGHELRTPLNAILGLTESLDEDVYGELSAEQRGAICRIHMSGHRLLTLIERVLVLSQMEAGTLALERAPVGVEEVCQASVRAVRVFAEEKNIAVAVEVRAERVVADPRKLQRLLVELLSNAVKFTPAGGRVVLEAADDPEAMMFRFTVRDTGIGIAPPDIGRLFRPFVQLDSQLSRNHEGAGLGLAVARGLARLHDGDIHVEAEIGKGSRFIVTLPHPPFEGRGQG